MSSDRIEARRREADLKVVLVQTFKLILPTFKTLRHEDVRTCGIPDLSTTGLGRTSWLEVKHGTPKFDSIGVQEVTMLQLAGAGFARYVIYQEDKTGENKRTLIVHPRYLKELEPEVSCVGFNHRFVVEYIYRVHKR